MGGFFGGSPKMPKFTPPAPPNLRVEGTKRIGAGFRPKTAAAGLMFGDPAAALGSQVFQELPGFGSLADYIRQAEEFLGQGVPAAGAAPMIGSASAAGQWPWTDYGDGASSPAGTGTDVGVAGM
mgnify:FL=1